MSDIAITTATIAAVEPVTSEEQHCKSPTGESVATGSPGSSSTTTSASNSDICRYYAKGICRFGDMCRFSHVLDDENQENDVQATEQSSSLISKCKKLFKNVIKPFLNVIKLIRFS